MLKMIKKILLFSFMLGVMWHSHNVQAQACYPTQIVTASYATGGASPYKSQVLWLTWGSDSQSDYPYGRHDRNLNAGSKSYASIHLGGDTYLCVEAEIIKITGGEVNSYAPGNYSGDSLDKLYNIGGENTNNKLVSGIINRYDADTSTLVLRAKATINGEPVRLVGLVVADAESLAWSGESIQATGYGEWNVIDIRKHIGAGAYYIRKYRAGSNQQRIEFQQGNDSNTGAVSFLKFNDHAYGTEANGFPVEFTASLKGDGLTALALGLIPPTIDFGDAPESYGAPGHLLHNLSISSDGIKVGSSNATDINTTKYNPGALRVFEGKFLGTIAPDADIFPMFSVHANGDDTTGSAGLNEEDAWPEEYRRFSYKTHYMPGNTIAAKIPYKNGVVGDKISGWIDFNLNGKFDDDERQTATITSAGNNSVMLTWRVPGTRKPYSTYVRLRYFDKNEDERDAVSIANYGEVEDHRIYILTPTVTNPMIHSRGKSNQ